LCQKEFPVEKMDTREENKIMDCTSAIPVKKMYIPGFDEP